MWTITTNAAHRKHISQIFKRTVKFLLELEGQLSFRSTKAQDKL